MNRAFFKQPTLQLARALLGKRIVHEHANGLLSGRIVEVEAYMGPEDRAAHSYGGRRTTRTEVMYGPPGYAYIYLIYGMYHCFNVVSGPIDKPEAILVRAVEPIEGLDLMIQHRFPQKAVQGLTSRTLPHRLKRQLTNGPGKLCRAFDIDHRYYGHDLSQSPLMLEDDLNLLTRDIACGPRINIQYAEDARDYPWRFWIKDHPFVSK
ncbi:DNA-3-methyladenine glycosylase [Pullulanibacillus pueri]|uniref:Putative 3-methyladenine DNA glycosylase n=1 Tax=Pullulanibacillus pueri TaxID=1437324 RepID=A0A8J3ENV4_9BACL|nr:DNA-3-methyladenine glycosylase [Pullulanibacillus pueri]MBM7683835.1 DNA-3-methyladenine glycosylase [Pullulanibacillus pueri]GGH87735.1 putative 3-methyladenine DNA glycosylase [Pullulanibacillus pueri]